ncbi:MAG: peptidoglycan DD-metalloendopeptidase family protein [Lewinellaceae bacterium]|nr:peptidoglycan DD-metalloendopeptidase family protein [Saprospiraceae bacterium]MCB9311409.1 peptidoglycan DD-metalloendopeptidase family protein [Lewinellaceae bacterium]HRW75333.1 peptidoglycan DD-metalloendopeptidase family protein [Saprospiraceae bacterium]
MKRSTGWGSGRLRLLLGIIGLTGTLGFTSWLVSERQQDVGFFDVRLPNYFDGLPLEHYQVETWTVQSNEILGSLLNKFNVPGHQQYTIIEACREAFNVRSIREGQKFYVFKDPGTCQPAWLIYEPNAYRSYRIHLHDPVRVEEIKRPVVQIVQERAGVIESSLWNALIDGKIPSPLIIGLEGALECAVDFHHLQKGDRFRVIYEEDQLEGERIGLGKIQAVEFTQDDSTYYAIYFSKDSIQGYYDLQGRPMRSLFLKAPVKFSRISSHFSHSRLHPVLKVRRPHLGTDFAAPYGTEILATASGTVTAATRKGGNGIFVKIRHNSTYETQYLHMQRIAKGIRPGVHVQQGQVIGYVGSTGLATGPHVCYRFWKNGKQVNPRREKLPEAKPMPGAYLPEYMVYRDQMVKALERIPYNTPPAPVQPAAPQEIVKP